MADDQTYLYYIADDDKYFVQGAPDEDQDDVYEKFFKEHGYYPDRVCGVIRETPSGPDVEVVWER